MLVCLRFSVMLVILKSSGQCFGNGSAFRRFFKKNLPKETFLQVTVLSCVELFTSVGYG